MLAHNMCQKSLSYVNKNQNGIFESLEFFTRQINEILTKQRKVEQVWAELGQAQPILRPVVALN